MSRKPLDALRHHVTGAIERGEAQAITEQRAAHTPGPWNNSDDGRIYATGEIIADATYGCLSRAETDGNTRLIAAAPDLLAALEGIINLHGKACNGLPFSENETQEWTNAHYVARAAIRKAKGE